MGDLRQLAHKRQSSTAVKYISQTRSKASRSRRRMFSAVAFTGILFWMYTRQDGEFTDPIEMHFAPAHAHPSQALGVLEKYFQPRKRSESNCAYRLSDDPLPVNEDASTIFYDNWPISNHRPSNQFAAASCSNIAPMLFTERPIITFITATQNPGPNFDSTLLAMRSQSIQNFNWIIVDDHSDDPVSLERLKKAAEDSRIKVVTNSGQRGLPSSRNVGLNLIDADRTNQPYYVAMIDDDDMYELTATEKAVWMLESNPQWALASFHVVTFGAENKTETHGAHMGIGNFLAANYIANTAVMRWEAAATCRYDVNFASGGEDWDYWMCLAEKGFWGGTLPEHLFWYRMNDAAFRKARWADTFNGADTFALLREKVHQKHSVFRDNAAAFPLVAPHASVALEALGWSSRIQNQVADTAPAGSILFMIPWLYMGGADIGAIRMVETLSQKGYRVTVVCTLYDNPAGIELRPQMMQHTHDVHVLPSFLRAVDFPRYIKYLADSRNVHTVLISNSMLAYEMLPALREQMPGVAFMDYLHNEAYDGWKSGGYPTYSILHQRYLDRSLACSHHLREWMIERGHTASRVGVVKLGVDLNRILDPAPDMKQLARKSLFGPGIEDTTLVILTVARLDPQKRSTMVPSIINELITQHGYKCAGASESKRTVLMVMVGDGSLKNAVDTAVDNFGIKDCFHMAGTQLDTSKYFQAADLFLLPSQSEGISVAVSEAMAAGLPIVAASAGALPEQVGSGSDKQQAGFVIKQQESNLQGEVQDYAQTIFHLAKDATLMDKLSSNGIIRVKQSDWHSTLLGLLPELENAKKALSRPRTALQLQQLPHPAVHLALQTQLLEVKSFVDFSVIYGALTMSPRSGIGRDLQLVCGESETMSPWIDHLETVTACDPTEELDVKGLQRSAVLQCGSWCIWDLRSPERIGWSFEGTCYRPMKADQCQQWFSLRPPTMLKD